MGSFLVVIPACYDYLALTSVINYPVSRTHFKYEHLIMNIIIILNNGRGDAKIMILLVDKTYCSTLIAKQALFTTAVAVLTQAQVVLYRTTHNCDQSHIIC